jgi:hypothetical protein
LYSFEESRPHAEINSHVSRELTYEGANSSSKIEITQGSFYEPIMELAHNWFFDEAAGKGRRNSKE